MEEKPGFLYPCLAAAWSTTGISPIPEPLPAEISIFLELLYLLEATMGGVRLPI